MGCPLRMFPLFNAFTILMQTITLILPHIEESLKHLKRMVSKEAIEVQA